jgi:hypothetical protein
MGVHLLVAHAILAESSSDPWLQSRRVRRLGFVMHRWFWLLGSQYNGVVSGMLVDLIKRE